MSSVAKEQPSQNGSTTGGSQSKKADASITLLDSLRILTGLVLLNLLASYMITNTFLWTYTPWWSRTEAIAAAIKGPLHLTPSALAAYSGTDENLPLYLALNNTIYDVSAGRNFYAPGGPYSFFAGRDAARAYVTGCFKEDSVPDLRGAEWMFVPKDVPRWVDVPDEELGSTMMINYRYEMVEEAVKEVEAAIEHWSKLFRGDSGKNYFEVGKVVGNTDQVGEMRELCEQAENKRPKSKFEEGKRWKGRDQCKRARTVKKLQLDNQRKIQRAKGKTGGESRHGEL